MKPDSKKAYSWIGVGMITLFLIACSLGWLFGHYQLVPRKVAVPARQKVTQARSTAATPEFWQMHIKLDASDLLDVVGVQWAIFSEDPLQLLNLRRNKLQPGDDPHKIAVAWDAQFERITGDKVYFLSARPQDSSGFASNEPDGKKWFVSKAVWIANKPYCWSIPFETSSNEPVELHLNRANALTPDKLVGE